MWYIATILAIGYFILSAQQAATSIATNGRVYQLWLNDPKPSDPPNLDDPKYSTYRHGGLDFTISTKDGGWIWRSWRNVWERSSDPRIVVYGTVQEEGQI